MAQHHQHQGYTSEWWGAFSPSKVAVKDSLKMHWEGCIGELSKVRVRKEMPLVREEALKLKTGPGVCGEAGVSVAGISNLPFADLALS